MSAALEVDVLYVGDRRINVGAAVAALREIAAACGCCQGSGRVAVPYTAHVMTDDPRFEGTRGGGHSRWKHAITHGPRVDIAPRALGLKRAPCPICRPIRQAIELLGETV